MTLDKAMNVLSDVCMKKYAVIALLLYCSMLIYIIIYVCICRSDVHAQCRLTRWKEGPDYS